MIFELACVQCRDGHAGSSGTPSHEIIDVEAPLIVVPVNTGVLANRVELTSGCRALVSSHCTEPLHVSAPTGDCKPVESTTPSVSSQPAAY
jgi:hypothetical protein